MSTDVHYQETSGERRTMHPDRLLKYRYVYPIFFLLTPILLYFDRFKWSALSLLIGFVVIGFQFRWKLKRLNRLKIYKFASVYFYTWILAVYGLWYDFFTGSVFLFLGFVTVLGYTGGVRWGGISVILSLVNLGLSALMFFFHLKYSVHLI